MNYFYNRGLDELRHWETLPYVWLLATDDYVPNVDHDYIYDVVWGATPINAEITVASYDRVTPTGKTRTINDTTNQILYSCNNPDFGNLEATQSARWLILARLEDSPTPLDSASPLVAAFDLGEAILLGNNFIVYLDPLGFAATRQVSS